MAGNKQSPCHLLCHKNCKYFHLGGSAAWKIVDVLTEAVSHTGDTIQTTIHKTVLPGGSMGPNGVVRISSIWRVTVGGGGQWWTRINFGGTNLARFSTTVQLGLDSRLIKIWNKGDATAQGHMQNTMLMHQHSANSAIDSMAKDTTQDIDIDFTAQCGNAAHVVTLAFAMVEVQYRD